MKPRIFVASTGERKAFADAVVALLGSVAYCHPWHQGVFEIGGNTQASLIRQLSECDFAVIILSGDDSTISRGGMYLAPRDNLIFEAGISFGGVHPTRTFLIPENMPGLKIPSDLAGFTFTQPFDAAENPADAMVAPVAQIRLRMQQLGRKPNQTYSGGPDQLASAANTLLKSADHTAVLFGRDLSWAPRYADTIRERVDAGVLVEAFSDKQSRNNARDNAKILTNSGAKVHYCDTDPRIKLTLIDHHSVAVCQFMVSFKERTRSFPGDGTDQFLYRYTIHDAREAEALWLSLVRLYESLKKEAGRPILRDKRAAARSRTRK